MTFGVQRSFWFCVDAACALLTCGKYCVSRNFPSLEDRATKTKCVTRGILNHRGRVSQPCSSFKLISIRNGYNSKLSSPQDHCCVEGGDAQV